MTANRNDCDDIAQKVCDYLAALAGKPSGAGSMVLSSEFLDALNVFYGYVFRGRAWPCIDF